MDSQQTEEELQNAGNGNESGQKMGPLGKTLLVAMVFIPLLGLGLAMVQLWNNWVMWQDLVVFGIFYVVRVLGVGIGFHRMLTHRSFDAPAPVRFFFLALGSMALQGPAIEWAATHLKHHKMSDKEGDPHSPLHGFWKAHVGWLFYNRFERTGVWVRPYKNDRVAQLIDKTFLLWAVLSFVLPGVVAWLLGGSFWQGVLWGGLVGIFFVHHVTWSVNSVCHTFGRREFQSNDESRNEPIVGTLACGEGYHNNHHAFPQAAYHGMHWWQVDLSAYVIRLMKWMRLVRNVRMPTREQMEARRIRRGGNSS